MNAYYLETKHMSFVGELMIVFPTKLPSRENCEHKQINTNTMHKSSFYDQRIKWRQNFVQEQ